MARTLLYIASFAAHGALALGVVSLKGTKIHDTVAISVVESNKPKADTKLPEPPPPPPPEPPKQAAKAKAAAPKAEATPPPSDAPPPTGAAEAPAVPDFGLSLSGGSGAGLAVAAPASARAAAPKPAEPATRKVLTGPAPADDCAEAIKKPKVVSITQPAYTTEAREASIAGKVRVEVTVDAAGHVSSARVLQGLGHGLDEAALAAARSATFEAGTRCGRPTVATFVIAIRFAL